MLRSALISKCADASCVVCPSCSNTLTVSRAPYNPEEPDFPNGRNRLECRTCPYQFLLDKRYYERKVMKRKEVEDVIGGKGSWDNVDQTDGRWCLRSDTRARPRMGEIMQGPTSDQEKPFVFAHCTTNQAAYSTMPVARLRWHASVLLSGPDTQRRRTDDHLLKGILPTQRP